MGKFTNHLSTGGQSGNVVDLRSPFGSYAVDPGYSTDDRNADFLKYSLLAPYLTAKPQGFKPGMGMSMQDLLTWMASQQAPQLGVTDDARFNKGYLK